MSNPYDFTQAPNIAGTGNYAALLAGLFSPRPQQQQTQQQQRPPQQQGLLRAMLPRNPDGTVNWASLLGGGTTQPVVPPTQPGVGAQPGLQPTFQQGTQPGTWWG